MMGSRLTNALRGGFTLMELLAVIAVMAVVAVFAASRVGDMVHRARIAAAESDLVTLRTAMLDDDSGYLRDMAGLAGFSSADIRIANLLIATNLYGMAQSVAGIFPRACRIDDVWLGEGTAKPSDFTAWNAERSRGWRGPYAKGCAGVFPSRTDAERRGFYPDVASLYMPEYFAHHRDDSIYGFQGEPAMLDPWGNPYVLQVPPPQAFTNGNVSAVSPEMRFEYARLVSAGADGKIDTPCFYVNDTNDVSIGVWNERTRRLSRQAGLIDGDNRFLRGDDLVLFLVRNDIDEGERRD